MVRPFALILTFLGLVSATTFAWNRLCGAVVGIETRLETPSPEVVISGEKGMQAMQAVLPGNLASDPLLVSFRFSASKLVRGPENWQDGRLHLEWLSSDGQLIRRDFLGSCWADNYSAMSQIILTPPDGANGARIHWENLGLAGTCRVEAFSAQTVAPRRSARAALIGIMVAWVAWAAALAGSFSRRCLLAGAVWVFAAWLTVLPGPWSFRLPLFGGFEGIRQMRTVEILDPAHFEPAPSYPMAVQAPNLLLRWKIQLKPLRPLLHGLLFFIPTLVLLTLIPWRPAALLVGILAGLIETSQWAIGFGFEASDLLDLTTDAIGIFLAVICWKLLRRRFPFLPDPESPSAGNLAQA